MLELRRVRRADALAAAIAWTVAIVVTSVFLWILADLLIGGFGRLSWAFLTQAPRDAGRGGGIGPILVSTAYIVGVCMAVALPMGLGCAVYLAEWTGRQSRIGAAIRASLDLLAAVPSIVFGLFGAVFFGEVLGLGFSILSGGLTLACMILPILVRSAEAGLRAVPAELRQASAALGLTRLTTIRRILLPAALPGLVVGLVLGLGRALAETAALIFTSGYVTRLPGNLLDSGRSLSVHIYDLAMNVPGGESSAYATALVLILVLFVSNTLATRLTEAWVGGRSRR